ncbi:MAG: translation initiation factor IF-2 [Bacteroidaceae bacterium]|nr:translation initiation factor IF-2 [Bacteroidaceae bacterium]
MPVRLNKALKELNVGINTVAEFLQKKGMALIDATPNAKITDEQYAALMSAFGDDKDKNKETRLDIQKRKEKESQEKAERKEKERKEQMRREAELKKLKEEQEVFKLQNEHKQELKVLGNINDLKKKEKKEEQTKVIVEQPKVEESVEKEQPKVLETKAPVQTEQEPVKPEVQAETEKKTIESKEVAQEPINFKKVGFIDLSNINSKTRPDKKSKSERKKEREEKVRQRQEAKNKYKESVMKEIGGKGNSNGNDNNDKKKRQRINKGKVDINAAINLPQNEHNGGQKNSGKPNQQGGGNNNIKSGKKKNKKKDVKVELTDEEVAKQVKETLARLTSKQVKSSVKNRKEKRERHRLEAEEGENADSKILQLTEFVTANELATMMNVPVTQVIATCMSIGIMVSINQRLDAETINIVAEEFGYKTNYVSEEVTHAIEEEADAEEDLVPRAPVITVMGHVDHGKTSLLDYIRKANVIAGEAGGITQHIGAYNVKMSNGKHITFLDTPGHEAFTAMRARGAKVTDIAIIIIAADDDVMPQTKEAIAHAVAANVPMVFAINKIDKPGANPEKIKEQLANMNYLVEDWGGSYSDQEISAKKGIGVEELMDKVLLEAEVLDLKANPNRKATGSIIESSLDKGRGYVATVLVQNGTLRQGDVVLAGTYFGKVKAMFNERGQRIQEVRPAEPALILGLNGAPTAGDTFHVMDSEQEARELAHKREQLKREQGLRTMKRVDLNELGRRIALGDFKELNLIVKGDVDGSIEALSDSLIKLSTEKIQVNVIQKAVGQISETDVNLAASSDAIIIGFQVRPSKAARSLADQEGVDIRLYSVIYDTIEEIKSAMEGMLAPETKEEITANLEVRQVYKISKVGTVAGAFVTSGKVQRTNKVRVIRDGIVVYTGQINALKRFKDDVKEVGVNFECGISIVNYDDIREGDILETFAEVEVKQKL